MYSYLEFYFFGGVCTVNHTHKSILCVIFWIYYVCQMRKYFNPHTYVEIFITLWQMWRQGFHLFVTQVLVIKISRYLSKLLFSLVNRKVLFANYVKNLITNAYTRNYEKLSCHVNFILRECIKGINIVRQEKKEDARENWKKKYEFEIRRSYTLQYHCIATITIFTSVYVKLCNDTAYLLK